MADPCIKCKQNDICHHDRDCEKYTAHLEYMRKAMAKQRAKKMGKLEAQEAAESGEVIEATFTPVDSETLTEATETTYETITEEVKPNEEKKPSPRALTRQEIISKHRSEGAQKRFIEAINNMPKGVNSDITRFVAKITQFEPIDYLRSAEDIYNRFDQYIALCVKDDRPPTAANFALALGVSRQRMYQLAQGQYAAKQTLEARQAINYCLAVLNAVLEQSLTENKIPTITGIYLSKANFGYTDANQAAIEDGNADECHKTAEEIRQKYADFA